MNSITLFWQGVLSNVLNPKIAILFPAFLPQFVDQTEGQVVLQMAVLGLIFAFFGLCFLVVIGWFAGSAGGWLANQPRYIYLLRWLTGGVLISLEPGLYYLNKISMEKRLRKCRILTYRTYAKVI